MCFDEGTLQTYLDGETTAEESRLIERHLAECPLCRQVLSSLEDNDNFVRLHLTTYKKQVERLEVYSDYNPGPGRPAGKQVKGVFALVNKYKKLAAIAAAAACLGIMFSFAPVRSAAAQLLTLFRVQKVETVAISMEELNRIQQAFYDKSTQLNIDNFGKVESAQTGEQQQVRLEEAGEYLGFTPVLPSYLPDGLEFSRDLTLYPASKVDLTLNVNNVNTVIKSLGGEHLLPENLDGKLFTLSFPQSLLASAGSGEGKDYRSVSFIQTRSPEIQVPDNTDVNEVRKAILDLPIIPEETKRKLASLENWQDTLYVPQPENGTTEEVDINGAGGVIVSENRGSGAGQSILMWQDNGFIYIVEGHNVAGEELIKTAQSLK